MNMATKLFFLVEFGTDYQILRRDLFETNEEAKNFCKKELHLKYNRKNGFWQGENKREGAKIITLILNEKNDK